MVVMPRSRAGGAGDGGTKTAMGYDGAGIHMGDVRQEGSSSLVPSFGEDAMWEMNMRAKEAMESGPYPERPGEPNCAYYVRTGVCRFGMTCKFNHPLNRKLAVATARMKGGFPERLGQLECQYYLKTGTCKFGATCKFHHPKDKAGVAGRAELNTLGYPLRPNETECLYYLRTGECKFGSTCKFHHPEQLNMMVPIHGSSIYPSVHSLTTGQRSYSGATNWPMSRTSYIPSPRWPSASGYGHLVLPQGLVQVSGWNAYPGQLGSISSPENPPQAPVNGQFYGGLRQSESVNTSARGGFSSYTSGSIPLGLYALQRENVFPERPGEPECVFYMKTGDCKYGIACRYHHPRERLFSVPDCALSPMGLPLRPGEPLCIFYSRYGICKFGPNCKFDHPLGTSEYDLAASSTDVPVVRSSSGAVALPLSSEGDVVESEKNSGQNSKTTPPQMASADVEVEEDSLRTPTSVGPVSSFS